MAHDKKRSAAVIFLGLYSILLGVFWLSNTISPVSWEETEVVKYEGRKDLVDIARRTGEQYDFKNEVQKKEFDAQYDKLKTYVERSDPEKVKRIPWINWTITAFIMVTVVTYVFSGVLLLRGFRRFHFYFRVGQYGFIAHYILGLVAVMVEALPTAMGTRNIIRVLYPEDPMGSMSLDSLLYIAPYLVMWFGLAYGMYIVLPKIIIRRSKAIRELL